MGAIDRLVAFGKGGIVGAALGAVAAVFLAPQSGNDLQRKVHKRIREARIAGVEAKAEKEEELIHRFRGTVDDPDALEDERARARQQVADAVQAIGLGLNAPGAIAAQDIGLRSDRGGS